MSNSPVVRFSVPALYPNALAVIQEQVKSLGDSLFAPEFLSYIDGDGPTSGFVSDAGKILNPDRSKPWFLARVKYFHRCFMNGTPVDQVEVINYPGLDG